MILRILSDLLVKVQYVYEAESISKGGGWI